MSKFLLSLTLAGFATGCAKMRDQGDICRPLLACPASVVCGRVSDGCNGMLDCGPCQLIAIEPSIASAGDTVTLEGTFAATATVNFPGRATETATILGPHRAQAMVPVAATAGDLTVSTGGATLGPLPFRRAPFSLGVQSFALRYEQADGARQMTTFAGARSSHTSAVVGSYLYVIGGLTRSGISTGFYNRVERASINADGTLGPFNTVSSVILTTPRSGHTSIVVGSYLYVIGGFGDRGFGGVERARINAADGSLEPFATVSGVTLATPRGGHTSQVVGSYLYVIGGFGIRPLNSVERASINADGSLGPFATVSGVTLTAARYDYTSAVVGNYLYVMGGVGDSGYPNTVERASINADGSLEPFATVSGVTLATGRSGPSSAVLGSYLYVIGGGSLSVERARINADGSLEPFATAGVTLSWLRSRHTSEVVGSYLYVIGGRGARYDLNSVERASINADSSLGSFATLSDVSLVTSRAGHTSAVVGNYLYVIGGEGVSVERATINADGTLGSFATVSGVTLSTPRGGHTSAVVGNYLYLIGGGEGVASSSVERASINADGSLGPFATVSGVTLATAGRGGSTSAVVGSYLYVIGGANLRGPLDYVDRASINADNSLSRFATLSEVSLATARSRHSSVVVENYLYVIGGFGASGPVNSVERASINTDGSLSTFATVSGVTLATARFAHTSAVVGSYLYVMGGYGAGGPPTGVERASIHADGSLGPFVTVSGVTLATPRGYHTSVAVGSYLYVIGGFSWISGLNSVERATLQ